MLVARLAGQISRRLSRPHPLRPRAATSQLRVMTYNTHHGADSDNRYDIEAIARTIDSCEPDVVALQEVDRHWGSRSNHVDQPAWYAERLGMFVHYAPNVVQERDDPDPVPAEYGLALLSRLPLSGSGHRLYAGTHAESRGLVAALVTAPGGSGPCSSDAGVADQPGTIRVINTHLSVRDRRARAREIAQLLSYADSEQDLPTVVAGDFNALTRARALRAMRTTYHDAWEVGRGSPATVPGRRIDYLWMSRHLRPVQTVVVRSSASDHYALVSDLAWARPDPRP
ncbi:MAG: endonuclease/exonuclease/phosphatase family protein [Propionibacteriaceae bacterium]